MKSLLTFITLAAGLVVAQDLSEIPACAQPCIVDAVSSATTCSLSDYKCWCTAENEPAIVQAGTACVLANCGTDVAVNKVLPAVETFCEEVNAS
ncbi:uncharacterized protein B0T23DRAFT_454764 [Neurospora hispaniola]|uniref:CFEM domain-containing protein n=1 Tax=Neurospora hispaniola TaxID=588809 RepID=A0AAJ0I6J6_9PEZI|nr:hypothetical protein B0T23DRAFT_454764 [Neurospora hispaniola]